MSGWERLRVGEAMAGQLQAAAERALVTLLVSSGTYSVAQRKVADGERRALGSGPGVAASHAGRTRDQRWQLSL